MDYYERLLYNQLVGSTPSRVQDYLSIRGWAQRRSLGKPHPNPLAAGVPVPRTTLYQEAAYLLENTLWVALYLPTAFHWDAKGVTLQQECLWPAERSTIRVTGGEAHFEMKLRVPYWATEGFDVKLNGVSLASNYQPSSYVTIPAREWSESDVVEVVMPFTKHIDFGPDKMETATGGEGQPDIQYAPEWAGTLMYGPLAMTATGVNSWDEATLTVDSYLESILLNGPSGGSTGTNGNLYTLTVGRKTFEPDYFRDENSTHYFRIRFVDDMVSEFREMLESKLEDAATFSSKNYTRSSYRVLKRALKVGEKMTRSQKPPNGR